MTVTPMGYLFFASILFGVLLMAGVSRRWSKNGKPIGIGTNLFFGFVLVTMSTLFFMFVAIGAQSIHRMVVSPKYEATIVGVSSAWEETRGSDGFTERTLMHTPMLRFTDSAGRAITQKGDIRSGAEPVIGTKVTVAYQDGRPLQVISLASIGLYLGLVVMLTILGYILTQVLFFTLGRKSKRLDQFGAFLLMDVCLGGGMLFMLAAMIYGVYSYFLPGSDMPFGIMLLCVFFSIVLAFSIFAMFRLSRNPK
ncbi:DUF3592 domain-containing protein [Roseobacter sp. CCS2]|uniref:DUF3592 domain-containing protein n=1 Tax=Roseobacter sp. CCS2 TaxID=391593 RepID=UPI0000F40593|nr:DUF3592 domain-containing protein [Roseobacter sp. CCS2]EBA11340.1 hypothetical protein RCCS2_01738 [Roseobacter sp. CCS2]